MHSLSSASDAMRLPRCASPHCCPAVPPNQGNQLAGVAYGAQRVPDRDDLNLVLARLGHGEPGAGQLGLVAPPHRSRGAHHLEAPGGRHCLVPQRRRRPAQGGPPERRQPADGACTTPGAQAPSLSPVSSQAHPPCRHAITRLWIASHDCQMTCLNTIMSVSKHIAACCDLYVALKRASCGLCEARLIRTGRRRSSGFLGFGLGFGAFRFTFVFWGFRYPKIKT